MLERRVATDLGLVVGEVHGVVGPVLEGHDRDLGAVADNDLDDLGHRGVTGVPEHHDRPRVRTEAQRDVTGLDGLGGLAGHLDDDGLGDLEVGRHID